MEVLAETPFYPAAWFYEELKQQGRSNRHQFETELPNEKIPNKSRFEDSETARAKLTLGALFKDTKKSQAKVPSERFVVAY
jgi:hypothetical protein